MPNVTWRVGFINKGSTNVLNTTVSAASASEAKAKVAAQRRDAKVVSATKA